jgi:ATP-dependent RNA helicase DeaD
MEEQEELENQEHQSLLLILEKYKLNTIEKQLNKKFINLPIPSGTEICEKQLFHLIDKVEKVEVDTVQVEPFLPKIYEKLEWMDRNDLIQRFVSIEFNRFLDYYKNLQDLRSPSDANIKKDLKAAAAEAVVVVDLATAIIQDTF